MPDEEAFSLLVRLMYSYDLRGHFLPEMPRLQLRLVGLRISPDTTQLIVSLNSSKYVQYASIPALAECSTGHSQFERLTEELLPVLHVHFLRQGVKSSMFCSQWFLTLFSYR
jgi:hypothetical protein